MLKFVLVHSITCAWQVSQAQGLRSYYLFWCASNLSSFLRISPTLTSDGLRLANLDLNFVHLRPHYRHAVFSAFGSVLPSCLRFRRSGFFGFAGGLDCDPSHASVSARHTGVSGHISGIPEVRSSSDRRRSVSVVKKSVAGQKSGRNNLRKFGRIRRVARI